MEAELRRLQTGKTTLTQRFSTALPMNSCRAHSREYLQQAIDAEIISLEESTRSLKHRRNALAPISSLPTEVISTIFSLLRAPVASSPLTHPTLSGKPDHLPWFRLSHVCRHWREIALDRPLLWNHLDFNQFSLAGAGEMLARAKMVPLHLEARFPSYWDDVRLGALQKELRIHASHICHLVISADFNLFSNVVEGLVSPAPILEYLSLDSEVFPLNRESEGICILDTLFDGVTPRLSCLKLRGCNISWKSPFLKGLRCLEIHHPSSSARPSLSVWLDALDEVPRLEMLSLHAASPIALPAPLPSGIKRTITLPSVSVMELSASARDCGLALGHLILPALTRLRLEARSDLHDCSDVQETLPYFSQHASRFQHIQSMIVLSDGITTKMLAWADATLPKPVVSPYEMSSAPLAFSFTCQNLSLKTHAAVFDEAMAALPLDNLLSLTSQIVRIHFEKQVWLNHAQRWTLLQCVCLSRSAAGFVAMLLEDNGGRENPLLPSLTTLVLVDAALSARRTLRLRDALMKRVEQGVPLEGLDLQACLATSRAVDLLSEIVVDVLGPVKSLEQSEHTLTRTIWDDEARGLFVTDIDSNFGIEDYDEDDPLADTGSDDDVSDHWDVDDDEDEFDESEGDNW